MKKITFSFLFVAFITLGFAQNLPLKSSGYIPFHQYLQQNHTNFQRQHNSRVAAFRQVAALHLVYNTGNSAWMYADSTSYSYTADGFETGGISYSFSNSGWVNSSQFSDDRVTYQINSITGQTWDGGSSSWINSYKYVYGYNGIPLLDDQVYQTWDGSNWANVNHYTYSYNVNNGVDNSIYQSWVSGAWQNDTQFVYTYNTAGQVTVSVLQVWNSGTSNWDNKLKQTYGYDANGNNFQIFGFTWNGTAWDNFSLVTKSHDAATGQLTSYTEQLWDAGSTSYGNSYQELYQYDFNDNNTQFENYNWNGTNWVPLTQNIYSYDDSRNLVYENDGVYNSGNNAFDFNDQYYYYYSSFDVNGVKNISTISGTTVFPNPVSNSCVVELNADRSTSVELRLNDALGRTLSTSNSNLQTGTNRIEIPVTGLAAGSYILNVVDKNTGSHTNLQLVKQ